MGMPKHIDWFATLVSWDKIRGINYECYTLDTFFFQGGWLTWYGICIIDIVDNQMRVSYKGGPKNHPTLVNSAGKPVVKCRVTPLLRYRTWSILFEVPHAGCWSHKKHGCHHNWGSAMSFETTETTTVVSCLPGPSQPVIKHGGRKSSVNQLEKRLNCPAKFDYHTGMFSQCILLFVAKAS